MNPVLRMIFFGLYLVSFYFLVYWFLLYLDSMHRMKKEKKLSPQLKSYPAVSILVPAHNEEKTIEKTLQSLFELDYPKSKITVYVLNNASSDATEQVVLQFKKEHPSMNLQYSTTTIPGKAYVLNKALKIIKTPYFACLDADSFVHKKALKHMIARFERGHSDLTVLTPVMKIKNPKTFIQKVQRIEYIFAALMAKLMGYIDANYVAPGPFSVYKTKPIQELGGFNEMSLVEDQEIAYRIQKKHLKIAQCSSAFVHTVGPDSVKALRKQRNRWIKGTILTVFDYRNLMFNKNYGDFGMFQLPMLLIYYVLGLFSLGVSLYYLVKPLVKIVNNLLLVHFDIIPFLKTFTITFDFWSIDFMFSFLIYVLFISSLIFLLIASKSTDEKLVVNNNFLPLLMYYYLYFLLLGTVLVEVCLDLVLQRRQRW